MDLNDPAILKELYISAIIRETANTKSFVLKSKNNEIDYLPGQFLTFIFNSKRQVLRRSYSMSSSPILHEPLTITVKRIDNGEISRLLHDKTIEGDVLQTIGASGFFTLPEDFSNYRMLIFFAAGSGIVPVYSLIKSAIRLSRNTKLLLIYSNRSMRTTIFYKQLVHLQKEAASRLHIEFLFSNSLHLRNARLTPESLEQILTDHKLHASAASLFYLCGPPGYMRMIHFKLLTLGIEPSSIKKEIFKIDKPAHTFIPPDLNPHTVYINNRGHAHQFIVQYPLTILGAAKKLKIPLPYSCETGQCGTCAATCVDGKVWMSYNAVLLDDELAKGKVLTCTGYPVHGDVTLNMTF